MGKSKVKNIKPTLNQEYLKKIAEVFMKNQIIEVTNTDTTSLNDIFDECILNQYKKYWKKNKRTATLVDGGREFEYINKHADIQVIFYVPDDKKTHQELRCYCEGIKQCFSLLKINGIHHKELNVAGNIQKKHSDLIAFILYDLFAENNLPLPSPNTTDIITTYKEFKAVITGRYVSPKDVELEDSWEKIYKSPERLCYYLFDITHHDIDNLLVLQEKLSDWRNILFDEETTIYDLYKNYAVKIIDGFSVHPIFEYLFSKNPLKHMPAVREILKHMISKNEVLRSPVISVLEWVNETATDVSYREKTFFDRDFLHIMGFLADKIKCKAEKEKGKPSYSLSDSEINIEKNNYISLYSDLYPDKVDIGNLFDNVVKSFKNSILCDTEIGDGISFKIKPFRLACTAIFTAFSVNHSNFLEFSVMEVVSKIESYFPSSAYTLYSESKNEVKLDEKEFHEKFDDYCFYGLSVLYNLDSMLLERVIDEFCNRASDFSFRPRQRQICYIYLLSAILLSDLKLSRKYMEKIFVCTYGKAMYSFQINYWNYLIKKHPGFFEEYVENTIKNSCTLDETNNYAKEQPLFFFVYGLMYRSKNIENSEPHIDFLKKCVQIQSKTWTEKCSTIPLEDIQALFAEAYGAFFTVLYDNTKKKRCEFLRNFPENIMYYVYGVQMLSYSLSNIINYCHTSIKDIIKDDVFKVILASDYYMRKVNPYYPKSISEGYLLCGSYRISSVIPSEIDHITNSFDFNKIKIENGSIQNSTPYEDYMKWLSYEFKSNNFRYAYLMCRLLKRTNFSMVSDKSKKLIFKIYRALIKKQLDIKFQSIFLSYDNFYSSII